MKSIFITAAHKSSGKTLISLGLTRALKKQGISVQTFKKGPDFIDPIWHGISSGKPCYNLDFNTQTHEEIKQLYELKSSYSDMSVIEGNHGLFDGMDLTGKDCNAAIAKLLDIKVLLILDVQGLTRGVAPLVQGYLNFDESLKYQGIILNKVAGQRHEDRIVEVLEYYTDLKVYGAIPRSRELFIPERHLGLQPGNEKDNADEAIEIFAAVVSQHIDIDNLFQDLGDTVPAPPQRYTSLNNRSDRDPLRIGVMRDAAFGFYYPDDLEAFEQKNCEIVFINAIHDQALPKVDALFLGGGFPEVFAEKLSANKKLMLDIKQRLEAGMPCYAECGGLMYLSKSIKVNGNIYPMVDWLDGSVSLHKKPIGRGLVSLETGENHPWKIPEGYCFQAHEFHHSKYENDVIPDQMAYRVKRGYGINGSHDGLVKGNTLANYLHLRNTDQLEWVDWFIQFIKEKVKYV